MTQDRFFPDKIIEIACAAGTAIMRHYEEGVASTRKDDGSPVTAADHASEAVIVAGLQASHADFPIVSEEQAAIGLAPEVAAASFWCVDPLDGTKEFISHTGEFVVCIALVAARRPTFGVLHAPVTGVTYVGDVQTGRAEKIEPDGTRRVIRVRAAPAAGAIALDSRSHRDGAELDRWLAEHGITERRVCGSALKFGLVAEGAADVYARFGPTSEWDTAAGHAVLEAAGGTVTGLDGAPLRYAKPRFLNPGFIARGAA